jgi:hypothetical protein
MFCLSSSDGTEFWISHSVLKALKEKAMEYAKQVEHRAKLLEKKFRCGCGQQVVEVKGLISQWDASKSLQNQTFDATIMDLEFDNDAVKSYKDLGKFFVKDVDSQEGLAKVIEYSAQELKLPARLRR